MPMTLDRASVLERARSAPSHLGDELIADLRTVGYSCASDAGVLDSNLWCYHSAHYRNADGLDIWGYDDDGYDSDGLDSEGYDRNGYNADGEYRYNSDGYDSDEPSGILLPYDYRPPLKFRGTRSPYFGLEIEITTDYVRDAVQLIDTRAPANLIYCKHDGSVEGLEMVTHPMSYEWAMSSFPWDMLPELREVAQATTIPSENGIHVHVGRDGFASPEHTYRWLKLWYRNPLDIQRIARRRASSWAMWSPEARKGQIDHVKIGKRGYDRYSDSTRESRYQAINTQNDATLEVRVFASTLRPQRAQAALQLVASSVEYTRELTAEAICHRHAWEWPAFMAWVRKSGEYPALESENRIRR